MIARQGPRLAGFLVLLLSCGLAGAQADPLRPGDWIATWQGSPTPGGTFSSWGCPSDVGLSNQTVRNLVHVSTGGTFVRARISNAFGRTPLQVGAASIAAASGATAAVSGPVMPLRFAGQTSITIAAGGEAVTDPVALAVDALQTLAISIFLPGSTGPATQHVFADQDNYLALGDQTAAAGAAPFTHTISCWLFLSGVEAVAPPTVRGTLIALGDSITDGLLATVNANRRYPDGLARRFAARKGITLAVVNAGIIGNELLTVRPQRQFGVTAPARLGRDVLNQPGASAVILLEGINDIGDRSAKASDLIPVYQQIIGQVHEAGLKIWGATLTPFGGSNPQYGGDYGTAAGEAERQKVNAWIRTSRAFDGVIDFDIAVRDPANPSFLLPAFVGDNLHPNDAGYQAMADIVNLDEIIEVSRIDW